MAKCAYCDSTVFGGVTAGGLRFCNSKCQRAAYILSVTKRVPQDELDRKVDEIWRAACPKCKGSGPVDVHRVYEVRSALVLTRWSTKQHVSCRSCAKKRQLSSALLSLVAGWWGFPWGLILTPVQVTRNIVAMCSGPNVSWPSPDLRKLVAVNLGSQLMTSAQKSASTPATPPPLPPQSKERKT